VQTILEALLGRWFVRRTVHEAQIENLIEQNCVLREMVNNANETTAAALKELRRQTGATELHEIHPRSTLH
jgi:hypothetical protein